MNRRIDDKQFDGAGIVHVLFLVACVIAGAVFGPVVIDALQAVLS